MGINNLGLTAKAITSPRETYLILDTPEGGLLERGLLKRIDENGIYDSFISLLPHILQIQDAILRVKYKNLTEFYPKLYQN